MGISIVIGIVSGLNRGLLAILYSAAAAGNLMSASVSRSSHGSSDFDSLVSDA